MIYFQTNNKWKFSMVIHIFDPYSTMEFDFGSRSNIISESLQLELKTEK